MGGIHRYDKKKLDKGGGGFVGMFLVDCVFIAIGCLQLIWGELLPGGWSISLGLVQNMPQLCKVD